MKFSHKLAGLLTAALLALVPVAQSALAADMSVLDEDVHAAVAALKKASPAAVALAKNARGLLIFPTITKAGFIVGAEYGQGALVKPKAGGGYYINGHYSIKAASYGLQAGVQTYGFALMLMTDAAVEHVETSAGWDLGVGPSIVVVDAGMARTLSAQTANDAIYAFTFGQQGLMAGLGLRGSKITPID